MGDLHIAADRMLGGHTLILWGDAIVRVTKKPDSHTAEIVAYPSKSMSVTFRQARAPYTCVLHLVDGRRIPVDLACQEHWGDIQTCYPDECRKWPALGWGNDSDGHVEIDHVTDESGATIPMDEFERDIQDFTVYHEG